MSVEAYYDQFFNWKKKLEEVNYICDEGWYIDDFLCGLKMDLAVRVWAYTWKPPTLYDAFCRAQIEERLEEFSSMTIADEVFEEMSHPNSLTMAETQRADGVPDKKGSDMFDDASGFVAKTEEALIKVGKVLDKTTISSPTAEKGELLGSVVHVSTLHECELLGNEVGQPHLLRMRSIKADHQMFDKMPELNLAMQNNRAAVHGELVLPRVLSYASEVTMGSFSISFQSMFEKVFMFIDSTNHEFDDDCWVDGMLTFMFDPGGVLLVSSRSTEAGNCEINGKMFRNVLNVMRIINEPTAAAIAYGLNRKLDSNEAAVPVFVAGLAANVELFVWDPGQCTNFVYILEDKDVFKRLGKGKILRDAKLMGLGSYPCSDKEISFAYLRVELGDFVVFIAAGNILLRYVIGGATVARSWTCILGYIWRRDFLTAVFNGLIDMHAKCGYAGKARVVFDQMNRRDDVT